MPADRATRSAIRRRRLAAGAAGGHDDDYWNAHWDEYLRFYADACND